MSSIRNVKILADLAEKGDAVVSPADGKPGIVASVSRTIKRLRVQLHIELDDGRSFDIGGSKFLAQP